MDPKTDISKDNKVMMTGNFPPRLDDVVGATPSDAGRNMQKSTPESSFKQKWRQRLNKRIFFDLFTAVAVIALICLMEFGFIPDARLGFKCQDPLISYPFRGDTVTMTILLITCSAGPLFILILIEWLREKSFKRIKIEKIWFYYREMLIGTTVVLLITEVMKLLVGEPRPHFLDSCEPDASLNCAPGTFVTEYQCTNTRLSYYLKVDSSRSFLSGHASVSVFVGLFCSYLIQMRIPSQHVTRLTKPLLICICITWSSTCSLSRITDRRHHWWDVLAGAVLGAIGCVYSVVFLHRKERNNKDQRLSRASTTMTILGDVKTRESRSNIV